MACAAVLVFGACGQPPAVDAGSSADAGLYGDAGGGSDAGAQQDAGEPGDAGPTDGGPSMLRLLFIGNSYVFVNDLPLVLRRIAATAGVPPLIDTQEVTVGGALLFDHWTTGTAQARIAERGWTHVVLQGQSVEPLLDPGYFTDYAQRFGDVTVDAGAVPTFYATWARTAGGPVYAEAWSGGTPDAMQDGLTQAYVTVARRWPGSLVVKVGEAFRLVTHEHPELALLQSDGSHPTLEGTYLAACVFYVVLTGRDVPAQSEAPAGVGTSTVELLRATASRAARAP
jgi:hypothetical protein